MNTRPKVLVVDDDAVVGRSFDRVLSKKGYAVSTALTGEEALTEFDAREYDVVFTDIKMPGMDGLEVAEKIKAKCPWTPVVVVTGYGTDENEARASVLGVNGFVRKPLTPEIIESITLKAMEDKVEVPPQPEAAEAAEAESAAAGKPGALRRIGKFVRNVGLLILAPFIGLVYALSMPFYGLYMLAKIGIQALKQKGAAS